MTEERIERGDSTLPFGAEYMIATYLDDRGEVVDKEVATRAVIVCYAEDGTMLMEAFGSTGHAVRSDP